MVHTFPKCICPKVDVIARMDFELACYDSAVQCFKHNATMRPYPLKSCHRTDCYYVVSLILTGWSIYTTVCYIRTSWLVDLFWRHVNWSSLILSQEVRKMCSLHISEELMCGRPKYVMTVVFNLRSSSQREQSVSSVSSKQWAVTLFWAQAWRTCGPELSERNRENQRCLMMRHNLRFP